MKFRVFLRNGSSFVGDDERPIDDMLLAVADGTDSELPQGWVWLGGLYVRSADVVGFAYADEVAV